MFEVALALGIPDVRYLLDEMPMEMLTYWITFLNMRKMKNQKIDLQMGLLTKVIAEKDTKANKPLSNYMIEFKSEEQRQEELAARILNTLSRIPGAKVQEF